MPQIWLQNPVILTKYSTFSFLLNFAFLAKKSLKTENSMFWIICDHEPMFQDGTGVTAFVGPKIV